MILSKREMLAAIKRGEIIITPFEKGLVGACSIDFRLGEEFRLFKGKNKVDLTDGLDYLKLTKPATKPEGIELQPGEMVLGVTLERLSLSQKYCGWIQGRSRIARMGLMVHVSSGLIQPGVDNKQVLEIVNLSPNAITLKPGVPICQVSFEVLSSEASYEGEFAKQSKP